jgi:hypothetical protein
MLFRLVRPVKRTGSRNRHFVRRIPSDVRSKAVGIKLSIPGRANATRYPIVSRTVGAAVTPHG